MTRAAIEGSSHDLPGQPAAARPGGGPAWRPPAGLIITVAAALALVLRIYRLTHPGLLVVSQYDDGPYFGSAVRLIHGALPYRDFVLVQPPGITLVMSPAALLSDVTGTAWAMVTGRLLTAAAGAAAVVLIGLLVRHRGLLAVAVACGIAAIYPTSVAAAHTILLEPWLVLACLAGAVAVFDRDQLTASTRRLAWGGAAFGFAGAIKAWAIVPVIVLLVLCLPQIRRAVIFAAGVAAGFLVPVLPFAALAPRRFFVGVISAQLNRGGARTPVVHRIADMIGVSYTTPTAVLLLSVVVIIAFVAVADMVSWRRTRQPLPALDRFALAGAVLVVVMLLWPPYYAAHYTAFFMPFLALSLALAVSRLAASDMLAADRPAVRRRLGLLTAGITTAAVLAGAVSMSVNLSPVKHGDGAGIRSVIPAGACVVTDQASYLLLANRFVSSQPGCPAMVDGLGTDLVLSGGRSPANGAARFPAVRAAWQQAFSHAQYLLLSHKNTLRVAWTPALQTYFRTHFRRVLIGRKYQIYARRLHPRAS
ncbi:MAG TPA: glycosyltransferase 87 family protein [Streptosporangiaceae bacterium]